MPSLQPGYEYDIFISYRQKDNKGDKWVTEFMQALKTELEATIKEDVSIYFDQNPNDGLLESHHVDKSLEGKLKCLIFIPILSQTYCDPKSFAWQHEFCAFNRAAQNDALGRDIRLRNGNVASRILPVRIHDLDAQDQAMVEQETGSALRAIDFIYKEPGVNRPLKPGDSRDLNQNKTDYRNQVNKVANAVKELVASVQNPTEAPRVKAGAPVATPPRKKSLVLISTLLAVGVIVISYVLYANWFGQAKQPLDKSIAVLPFTNMTNDSTQNYFTDGMADDILNHLSKVADLKVKSRTSTQQYRNTQKSMPEIAEELGAGTILEGSVRKVGNQVRIVVQLIDARNDVHIWSETYDRPLEDVLKLQSEIAIEVSRKLAATLTTVETEMITKVASTNLTAYDYFLQARELIVKGGLLSDDLEAQRLLRKAVQLDPEFAEAYAEWAILLAFDESRITRQAKDSALLLAKKSIALDNRLGRAYYARYYYYFLTNQFPEAFEDLKIAHEFSPNDGQIMWSLGINYYRAGKYLEGARLRMKSLQLQENKASLSYTLQLARHYQEAGESEYSLRLLQEATNRFGQNQSLTFAEAEAAYSAGQYDETIRLLNSLDSTMTSYWRARETIVQFLAEIYFNLGRLPEAKKLLETYSELETHRPDTTIKTTFRHKLGYILCQEGNRQQGLKLIQEDLRLHEAVVRPGKSRSFYVGVYQFNLAAMHSFLGNKEAAYHYLDSALQQESYDVEKNSMFNSLRQEPRFQQLYKRKQRHWQMNQAALKKALREFEAGTLLVDE